MGKKFLYAIVFMAFSYGHSADNQDFFEDWFPKNPKKADFKKVLKDLKKINNRLQKLQGASNAPHHVLDEGSPRLDISRNLALNMRLSADTLQNYSQNYCLTLRSIAAIGCYAAWSGAYLLEWTATYWCPKEGSKGKNE